MKSEREQYEEAIKRLGKTDSYTFDKHEDGSYKFDMIHFGWKIWQTSANRQGYKLVPIDELLRKVQNIRALNTGEYESDEIEENVCEIEAMIGAVE